jgi:hypothetical protein
LTFVRGQHAALKVAFKNFVLRERMGAGYEEHNQQTNQSKQGWRVVS